MKNTVTVLIATYNGEKYIEEQLNSVLCQTEQNLNIIIRDDGSKDSTWEIVNRYAGTDSRITAIRGQNIGVTNNYKTLLGLCTESNYIMFCDQDDIWLETKVEDSLNEMQKYEKQYRDTALLLYSNKQLVDEFLLPIDYEDRYRNDELWDILCKNHIYGCTMMFNKLLWNIVKDIPDYVYIYDYWISLNAAIYGKIIHLNKNEMLYRQHSKNVTGGHNNFSILNKIKNFNNVNSRVSLQLKQNYAFCINNPNTEEAQHFIQLINKKGIMRLLYSARSNYVLDSALATLRLWYVLLHFSAGGQ